MKLRYLLPIGALLAASVPMRAAMAETDCPTDALEVRQIMTGPMDGKHTIIFAHRGVWAMDTATGDEDALILEKNNTHTTQENSISAFEDALRVYKSEDGTQSACIDGVELDLRSDKDGNLIVTHDTTLGRSYDLRSSSAGKDNVFDLVKKTGYNPKVSDLTLQEIQKYPFYLFGREFFNDNPQFARTVSDIYKKYPSKINPENGPLIAWDVKDKNGIIKLLDILKSDNNTYSRVLTAAQITIIKFNEKIISEADYRTELKRRWPQYFDSNGIAKDPDMIPLAFPFYTGANANVKSAKDWINSELTASIEINVKEYNEGNKLKDLLSDSLKISEKYGPLLGINHITPDAPIWLGKDYKGKYLNADGSCCWSPNERLDLNEEDDGRSSINFITRGQFRVITTDRPSMMRSKTEDDRFPSKPR